MSSDANPGAVEALKPCPFCGDEAIIESRPSYSQAANTYEVHRAWCDGCMFGLDWHGHETDATDAWNTRSAPAPNVRALVEALAEIDRLNGGADWRGTRPTMNSVSIPWPDKGLSPNARLHHHAKAKLVKIARESAYWLTKAAWIATPDGDGEIMVHIDFHPPDKRRYDLDGLLSRAKSAIDGFADALEVNDYRFAFTLRRCQPVKGGKVVLWIDQFVGLADELQRE